MRKLLSLLALLLAVMPQASANADVLPPDTLIKNTVDEVLAIINSDKALLSNEKRLLELVDAKILPHFDFSRMTRLAVGRGWKTSTPEQQRSLTHEFRTLMVRTYTKVFTTYADPKVAVKAAEMQPGGEEATVHTIISLREGRTAKVDYEMQKSPNGWKAFDVTVEGISLVSSKRGEFADQIKQSGVEGLIAKLAEMNRSAASNAALKQQAGAK